MLLSSSFSRGDQSNMNLNNLANNNNNNSNNSTLQLPQMQTTSNNIQATTTRPGQQLLPNYAMKLLKNVKIPFGTDRTMNGVDIDPTLPLLSHIIDCFGTLRDVNKIYRSKGSLASRSVGARVLFGFTAELGNLLLDAITFNPPSELKDAATLYINVGSSILSVFPEIAAQITKQSGKMLIHHTALKASAIMASDALKMVLKAYPAGAWTVDASGALPLHWLTHNPCCTPDLVTILVNANPKGPWIADNGGYLPLHWAVNQPNPNIEVVAALLAANPSAASKPCLRGTLALHWCVSRDNVNIQVLKALLQVYADGARTFDDEGCLPLHRLVNRSAIDIDALKILIDTYPQALQCPNADGELPLHLSVDQTSPDINAIELILESYPGALQVADDEGYLPLHVALDCSHPNVDITKLLLKRHQQGAYHRTNDGLLPLHCIISSMQPSIEIIRRLLKIYPTSSEEIAVDLVPIDDNADPEMWNGDWKKLRWTPLSRAIERRLDPIVSLFKAAMIAYKQQQQELADGIPSSSTNNQSDASPTAASTKKRIGNAPSAATTRALGSSNATIPPIHSNNITTMNKAMDNAEVMMGSELDESMDVSAFNPLPNKTKDTKSSANPNDEAIDDLLAMISSSNPNGAVSGPKNPVPSQSKSPKYRSSNRSMRRKNSNTSDDPSSVATPGGGNQSQLDSSYSQLDSFISNGESGNGFDLSASTRDETDASKRSERDDRRRHRRHHHSSHHRSSRHDASGSVASEIESIEGNDKLHAHHHHGRHHRGSTSSHRSHSSTRHHHHRDRSTDRERDRDHERSSDRDRERERPSDREREPTIKESSSKQYIVQDIQDDIDEDSMDIINKTKRIQSAKRSSDNDKTSSAPSQPKPFLDEPTEQVPKSLSSAITSANNILSRQQSTGSEKLGHVAVDIKLPSLTPKSQRVQTKSGSKQTNGYETIDDIV